MDSFIPMFLRVIEVICIVVTTVNVARYTRKRKK